MAETTENTTFTPTVLGTAVRNGATVTVQTAEFKRQSKDKEGANFVGINTDYIVVDTSVPLAEEDSKALAALSNLARFIGVKDTFDMVVAKVTQKCQGIWREAALNETGKSDADVDDNELTWDNDKCLPVFINLLQEWSAVTETKADLVAKRNKLATEIADTMLACAAGKIPQSEAIKKCEEIAKALKKADLDIASKKRKSKEEKESEKAAGSTVPVPA